MSYELTELLNRCSREDAEFFLSIISSCVNFSDDRGLRDLFAAWRPGEPMPLALNHKLETEIRYLGSNDFAYVARKMRGDAPAGVSIDEIINDLCKLMKIRVPASQSLEARLEMFAGSIIDDQFRKLPPERQRDLIDKMGFDEFRRSEILDRIRNNREALLPVILPLINRSLAPNVLQALVISILAPFIGREAARQLLVQIAARIPAAGAALGPLLLAGGAGWLIVDMAGPASRKTIPLILYLGVIALRDGTTGDFDREFAGRPE